MLGGEIMKHVDFKQIPQSLNGSTQNSFEFFARDFFECLGFEVIIGPGRGPDEGKDLVVEEKLEGILQKNIKFRWLVSCKHFAHSGKAVSHSLEPDILGRVQTHKCNGFICFYSTLPTSGLRNNLERIGVDCPIRIFDKAKIEKYLFEEAKMRSLRIRYFPHDFLEPPNDYTWEKLYIALVILASGNSDVKDRLVDAYTNSIMHLNANDFPKELQARFLRFESEFSTDHLENLKAGRIRALVDSFDEMKVKDLIIEIVSLFSKFLESPYSDS
jgi:hypothetical protein